MAKSIGPECNRRKQERKIIIIKITLDTNCLIDVEEKRAGYTNIMKLKELNDNNIISLRIPAISASEKKINKERMRNFDEFNEYLNKIDLTNLEQLYPFMIWNITFWGKSIWSSEEMINLERSIHKILFPNIPYNVEELKVNDELDQELYKKWRNSRCDSIVLWSHIYYKGDIFITSDNNFLKPSRYNNLLELGACQILRTNEIDIDKIF